jgi:C-terminal processing protease CtpA/Prc
MEMGPSTEDGTVSGGTLITIVADKEVSSLGFSPTGVPPSAVVVTKVVEHSWAAREGIAVGDALMTVDSRASSELTKAEIQEHLQQRPVRLTFLRPASMVKATADLDSEVMETLAKISGAKEALQAAAGEAAMLDSVLHHEGIPSGAPKSVLLGRQAHEALVGLAALSNMRSKAVNGAAKTWDVETDQDVDASDEKGPFKEDLPFTVEADSDVQTLGFACSGELPGILSVARVDKDGWAERQGVEENDVLLLLDEKITADLSKQEFMNKMQKRPLKLTFLREYSIGARPPPAHLVIEAVQMMGRVMTGDGTEDT